MWVLFKPVRVVVPELLGDGVTCGGVVCAEEAESLPLAQWLHAEAMANISAKLLPLRAPPRTIFCSTRDCYSSFGGGSERGAAILDLGGRSTPLSGPFELTARTFEELVAVYVTQPDNSLEPTPHRGAN